MNTASTNGTTTNGMNATSTITSYANTTEINRADTTDINYGDCRNHADTSTVSTFTVRVPDEQLAGRLAPAGSHAGRRGFGSWPARRPGSGKEIAGQPVVRGA
jgi:hypothetical protein